MGDVIEGPWTRDWHCPTCARRAPFLLPNGAVNRMGLGAEELSLADATVGKTARQHGSLADVEVCLSCGESIPYLVGSLVVPYGQQGTVLAERGRVDTQIIGAIVPVGGRERSALMLFFGAEGSRLALVATESLAAFTAGRLTSPSDQGAIPDAVWRLFQNRLEWLSRREGGQSRH